jgi:hypothetical protein
MQELVIPRCKSATQRIFLAMDLEKPTESITHAETVQLDHHGDALIDTSGVDEKKLMRKIDFKLIPWLCVLYLLSFLDRSAIGNAKLYGLTEDLHLTSTQYNICLTVFFFPCESGESPPFVPGSWLNVFVQTPSLKSPLTFC